MNLTSKIIKQYTLLLLLFSYKLSFSQNFEWANSIGNNENNQSIITVVTDIDGNVYNVGSFRSTIDFDPGPGVFNLTSARDSVFVQKLDASGNFIWAKAFNEGEWGSKAYDATVDSEGNLIFVGSEINIPIGNVASFYNALIYKLDPSGNVIFRKESSGGNGASNKAIGVVTDNQNNIYVTGYFATPIEFGNVPNNFNFTTNGDFDIFVFKLDTNGNYAWVKRFGGTGWDISRDINIDISGHIYIVGSFSDTVDFDPGTGISNLTSNGIQDGFICKLDNDGNLMWNKRYGNDQSTSVLAIDTDVDENVFLTGIFKGTIDFDSSSNSFNITPEGNNNASFITKLDSNGSFIWVKSIGGDEQVVTKGILIDDAGNFYVLGIFFNTVDFDPSASVNNLSSNGSGDFFLQKYCEETLLWTETFGGTDYEECHSIDIDVNGNIILGGIFHNTVDFDPSDTSSAFFTSAGFNDIFTVKFSQNDFITPVAYSLRELFGCDENNDGISEYFDTSLVESEVLGNQAQACFEPVVSYYDNQGNELPNPLPNPFTNTTSNIQVITVRVSNELNTNYFSETSLTLQTYSGPIINNPTNLYACDEGNGIGIFDTSLIENQLIGTQNGLVISYFDENGNSLPSPLPNMFENTISSFQTIFVRVEDLMNPLCYSETSFNLIVNNTPEINLNQEYFICDFEPSLIISVNPNYDLYEWVFENGNIVSSTFDAELIDEGNYTVTATLLENNISCIGSFTFQLIRSTPPEIQLVNYEEFGNNFIEIIASGNGDLEYSIDGINFQDSNLFNNIRGGIYNVIVRDKGGCGEDSREVVIVDFPKFFTPNHDSYNDYWQILGISKYPNSKIYIFDRYGKLLKQISPNSMGWDGLYNGNEMGSNDYWFIAYFNNKNTLNGHFTLKR